MSVFTFDTSGVVIARIIGGDGIAPSGERTAPIEAPFRWEDLSPFEQGYVEAMFASIPESAPLSTPGCEWVYRDRRFSDLAPETLAAIRKNCAARKADWGAMLTRQEHGRQFFEERQRGDWGTFPPLTPILSEDGKVRFAD